MKENTRHIILIIILLIAIFAMCSCNNVVNIKSRIVQDINPSTKTELCWYNIAGVRLQDSCNKYNIGDTIKLTK